MGRNDIRNGKCEFVTLWLVSRPEARFAHFISLRISEILWEYLRCCVEFAFRTCLFSEILRESLTISKNKKCETRLWKSPVSNKPSENDPKSAYRLQSDVAARWHGSVFDELTDGQAVMHYSSHRLTASAAYVITLMYASANDQRVRPALPLVSSSKTKPCHFSSVQLRRYAPLEWDMTNCRLLWNFMNIFYFTIWLAFLHMFRVCRLNMCIFEISKLIEFWKPVEIMNVWIVPAYSPVWDELFVTSPH